MKVSLVIPIYNEANHILDFLRQIDALDLEVPKELIIVDDKSTDGTLEILVQYSFKSEVIIVKQSVNQGKGAALAIGISQATGEIIGIQDADFEYDMQDITVLIAPLIADRADVVYGSRFKKSGDQVHRTYHYLINRTLTTLSNLSSGLYLTDMETCYKFFKKEIIQNIQLESKRFGFEPEITAKIARLKLRVVEYPIRYFPRNYLHGKKITWKDGVAALWHIFYYNFLEKPSQCFKADLPKKYLPATNHWL